MIRTQQSLRALSFFIVAVAALLLPVCIQAQDPGIRDSVVLEFDELVVGQSRPITMRLVNDSLLAAIVIPLGIFSGESGGFAVADSAVWVGRIADPSVMPFRRFTTDFADGIPPDSVQIVLSRSFGSSLPPGNDVVVQIYLTGTAPGAIVIDTIIHPPANSLLANTHDVKEYIPYFEPVTIPVTDSVPPPPAISVSGDESPVTAGSSISLWVSATSDLGGPLSASVISLRNCDDTTVSPLASASFSGGNPWMLSWTPGPGDIGIWCATVEVCDTSGACSRTELLLQVVEASASVVTFDRTTVEVDEDVFFMSGADFSGSSAPELFVGSSGSGYGSTEQLYDMGGGASGTLLYDYRREQGFTAGTFGYVDTDSDLDVVFKRLSSVVTLLGNGSGGFTETEIPAFLHGVGKAPGALGEFTGDGWLDYVHFLLPDGRLYYGQPGGAFDATQTAVVSLPEEVKAVNSADFDGDGDRDLAVGTIWGLRILLNDGTGSFSAGAAYAQTYGTSDIQVTSAGSDFNHDGNFDLSLATPSVGGPTSELVVYFGNGDGTFSPSLVRTVFGQIPVTQPGDFNNDTHLDIAIINSARNYAGILFGDGSGTFSDEIRLPLDNDLPTSMTSMDYDVDGDLDLVVYGRFEGGNYNYPATLTVLRNTGDPGAAAVSLHVEADGNAELSLQTAEGYEVDRLRSTLSSGAFFERSSGTAVIAQRIDLGCLSGTQPAVRVMPRVGLPAGAPFSLDFTMNGKDFRLAEDASMSPSGYVFSIQLSGGEVFPASGSFTYNTQPTFVWPEFDDFHDAPLFELATDLEFQNIVHMATLSGSSYTLPTPLAVTDTTLYYWRVLPTNKNLPGETYALNVIAGGLAPRGDVTGDGQVNLTDVTVLVNWLFLQGPEPSNPEAGDVNDSGAINLTDLTLIVNYLFFGQPLP